MRVRATSRLPYLLRLADGEYGDLRLSRVVQDDDHGRAGLAYSEVALSFDAEPDANTDERQRIAARKAQEMLLATNRLLRWYRATTNLASVLEVTQVQLSPFRFVIEVPLPDGPSVYHDELSFEPPIRHGTQVPVAELERRVREGVTGGGEPAVAELFLLDAEAAKDTGRFREAVLFSWSTIDSVFNSAYDALVKTRLAGERSDSRDFLQGKAGEIPLKVKMTAMLRLLSGRSLFADQTRWQALQESYQRRNGIIHSGDSATETDATQALGVARWVVDFMKGVRASEDCAG
jgi:hypothetical protein